MRVTKFLLLCLLAIVSVLINSSCANIIPPTGGARDSLAPVLVMALPKDSAKNVTSQKIVLTFDEFVEVQNAYQNVQVNPLPANQPNVDFKLKNVSVKLRDSLLPNTTYSINFGDAIKDVNEGNVYKNFTYLFSTGKYIDSASISGSVINAENGLVDSTLQVLLHISDTLTDSTIYKYKPIYITNVNGKGEFSFKNLPHKNFSIFSLPNSFTKKYNDSTKLFAFSDAAIKLNTANHNVSDVKLLAFKYPEEEKKRNNSSKPNAKEDQIKLRLASPLQQQPFNILDTSATIQVSKSFVTNDSFPLLITDTNFNTLHTLAYTIDTAKNSINLRMPALKFSTAYKLLINKKFIKDKQKNILSKNDTINFNSFSQKDYGKINFRIAPALIKNIDKQPLVILMYSSAGNTLVKSIPVNKRIESVAFYTTGTYIIRLLVDANKNGVWDNGHYLQKRQPERVFALPKELEVKANWLNDYEVEIQ